MWTMRDELMFVDNLGYHRGQATLTAGQKVALLQGYKKGLDLRTVWAGLNREQLVQHVDELLATFMAFNPNQVL